MVLFRLRIVRRPFKVNRVNSVVPSGNPEIKYL